MREMADGSYHLIVLFVVQNQRNCSDSLSYSHDSPPILIQMLPGPLAYSLVPAHRRSDDIVSIFQKMVGRMFVSGFLGACHGMTSHKDI